MVKRKKMRKQTMVDKNTENFSWNNTNPLKTEVDEGAPEGFAVPVPLVI